jgi:hypothetical protein
MPLSSAGSLEGSALDKAIQNWITCGAPDNGPSVEPGPLRARGRAQSRRRCPCRVPALRPTSTRSSGHTAGRRDHSWEEE